MALSSNLVSSRVEYTLNLLEEEYSWKIRLRFFDVTDKIACSNKIKMDINGKNDSYFSVLFFHIYFSPHHFPQHWGLKPDKDSTTELPPPQSFSSPTNFSLAPFPPVSLLELLGLQRADLPNSHPSFWSMPKFFPDLITCIMRLSFKSLV